MVVLHVKSATSSLCAPSSPEEEEEMQFLHQCAATAAVAEVAAALAGTAGLQARLFSLFRRLRGARRMPVPAAVSWRGLWSEAEAYANSKDRLRASTFKVLTDYHSTTVKLLALQAAASLLLVMNKIAHRIECWRRRKIL